MIVIADTSPVNYLVLISAIDLLPELYEQVVVPGAVLEELLDRQSPRAVRGWASQLPAWAIVQEPRTLALEVADLGRGERQAITLAMMQINRPLILMDERKVTDRARSLGLETIGLLGVLMEISNQRIGDGHALFHALLETNFSITTDLRDQIEAMFQMPRGPE